jgi:hypothetical protein
MPRFATVLGASSVVLACKPSDRPTPKAPYPPSSAAVAPAPSADSQIATWHVTFDTSRLDNKIKTSLIQTSDDHSLVIRLLNDTVSDFYVRTPDPVATREGQVAVRFKLDTDQVSKGLWSTAEDYHGIFAPDPGLFVHQLAHSSTLVFEYSPWQKVPKEVVFHVAALPAFLVHMVDSTFAAGVADTRLRDSLRLVRARKRKQEYRDSLRAISRSTASIHATSLRRRSRRRLVLSVLGRNRRSRWHVHKLSATRRVTGRHGIAFHSLSQE